ncbi:DUF2989 domain-containing protein [Alteromonas aestuariivivens]|uniref:DUF2989 domain-containing protein n=2 Tax=Alteromonas aestuariivivens TaxID=1938339 RepID=A0A3D8M8I3_9ALTE|nr:DUF2989 domain-containing protein [Alteromonas aestuariivivens]
MLGVALISGCEGMFEPSIAEICRQDSGFCDDLNPDGWCRAEKAEIIRHRYRHREDETEFDKYQLLMIFEDYKVCIGKAAQIQHIKYREKETGRMKGLLTAQREIKRLSRETRHSQEPHLVYYQWSRYGHEDALKLFLDYAEKDQLTTPDLQIALASIQVKTDLDKTKGSLYRALSLYSDDQVIDDEIFDTLVTIALDQERYHMAYVWSRVASHFSKRVNDEQLAMLANKHQLSADSLDDVADEITNAIEGRDFDAHQLGLDRL